MATISQSIGGQDEAIVTMARQCAPPRRLKEARLYGMLHIPCPTGVGKTALVKAQAKFMFKTKTP
jgi:ATP-dependent Clp protease ATP-binding subunit ClpA